MSGLRCFSTHFDQHSSPPPSLGQQIFCPNVGILTIFSQIITLSLPQGAHLPPPGQAIDRLIIKKKHIKLYLICL